MALNIRVIECFFNCKTKKDGLRVFIFYPYAGVCLHVMGVFT